MYSLKPEGGGIVDDPVTPDKKNLFSQFQDTEALYRNKSTGDIYFSLMIYKLCTQQWLVDFSVKLLELSEKYGLSAPLYSIVRKTFYKQFCAGEEYKETEQIVNKYKKEGISVILDYCNEDATTVELWNTNTKVISGLIETASQLGAKYIPLKVTSLTSPELLERMSDLLVEKQSNPNLDLSSWESFKATSSSSSKVKQLSSEELNELKELMTRLKDICSVASKNKISILMDAEQTFRQPAIDYLAIELSKTFNRTFPLLYNTYQLYLKETPSKLYKHIELSKKDKFYIGAKIVRGAYIVTESQRAKELGYENPIFDSKMATDDAYNQGVSLLIERIAKQEKIGVVIASHNLESVLWACQKIRQNKLPTDHPNIDFAQLKGMSDYLTYGLAQMNFNVNKLLPWGPVQSVIPYLTRRAIENRDVLGGTNTERLLLWKELKRRNFGFPL